MLGVELGLKDYPHVPGVLLGVKDHLQVARTTAQSSLKLLLAAVIFRSSSRRCGCIRHSRRSSIFKDTKCVRDTIKDTYFPCYLFQNY